MSRFEPNSEIGLMPMPLISRMSQPKASLKKRAQLLGLGAARLDLEPGVDVLGVLTEDHHVDAARGA